VYEKYDGGKVYLNDDSHLNIVGHGRVLIRFPDGKSEGDQWSYAHYRFGTEPTINSTLNDVGVQVVFSNGGCKMV
jgi:hypothetical protein